MCNTCVRVVDSFERKSVQRGTTTTNAELRWSAALMLCNDPKTMKGSHRYGSRKEGSKLPSCTSLTAVKFVAIQVRVVSTHPPAVD